ncbi:GSCOCG00003513001-RA-CDS [Cotesia congregata]|nr:GSCOCG00003513001-RA-CDS [Cotesia congregata]
MSGSDDKESQCEERTTESNNEIMGDVLAKEAEESGDAVDAGDVENNIKVDADADNQTQVDVKTQFEIDAQPNQDNDNYRDETTDSEDESHFRNSPCEADAAPEIPVAQSIPESTSTDTQTTQTTNDIWNLSKSLDDDDDDDDDDNEELSSYFGQTQTIKHEKVCTCEVCVVQRAFIRDKITKVWNWQSQGLKIREYIRAVFNAAIESPCVPNIRKYECDPNQYAQLREIVNDLVKSHPHKFFLMLVIQAQEFVVELKIRIMRPLQDDNLARIAEVFLTRLLNGYDILIATAAQVTDLIKPLEDNHLSKFTITWEFFNKKLYQNYIYFYEPTIRNILPSLVRQLRKPRKGKGYKVLLERYLGFVDEMMQIADLWLDKELNIDKYNAVQTRRIIDKRKASTPWTLYTIEEATKVENERTLDVPGLGLNQTPFDSYFIKLLERLESPPDTALVRKMLDAWSKQAYQTLALSSLGIYWHKEREIAGDGTTPDDPGYYFGYQAAAWLVLSRATDTTLEIDTKCTVCGELAWVSHLVVGGRTKTGQCAHPTLKANGDISTASLSVSLPGSPSSTGSAADSTELVNTNHNTDNKKRKGCLCTYRHLGEWQGSTFRGLLLFPPCLCMLNMRQLPESACPCVREEPSRLSGRNNNNNSSNNSNIIILIIIVTIVVIKQVISKFLHNLLQ